MKLRILSFLLTLIFVLSFFPTISSALTERTNILFVLDSSGSMAQKFGNETKIQAAKRIFSGLLSDLPEDAFVGLEVYGHYGNKDCSAIEVINPIKPLDSAAIKVSVSKLSPEKGATPIAAALDKGAEALKGLEGKKAMILISDGEETCGGDPVAIAKRIRNDLGIDVQIHVVGLDVSNKEKAQLAAIAEAGDGKYYAANNAEQLKESLADIKEKVVRKEIFIEEFDRPSLSEDWKVLNNTPDNRTIEDGVLYIISSPGSFSEESVQNVLLYSRPIKEKNYEIETKLTVPLTSYGNNFNDQQWNGIILYANKDNIIGLVVHGFYGYYPGGSGNARLALFYKVQGGKWTTSTNKAVFRGQNNEPQTYFLKIEKRGFKYTAYFSLNRQKWQEVGTIALMAKALKPGIFAVRGNQAQEVIAEFDSFVIRKLQ